MLEQKIYHGHIDLPFNHLIYNNINIFDKDAGIPFNIFYDVALER